MQTKLATKGQITVTSCEPDSWNAPGHWGMSEHKIVVGEIMQPVTDFFGSIENAIFLKLQAGEDFSVEGDDLWCESLEEVFEKKNIHSLAKKAKDVDQFLRNLKSEVQDACFEYLDEECGGQENEDDEERDEPSLRDSLEGIFSEYGEIEIGEYEED